MVTGVIKNKVDKIWTDIWAGGITNPITVDQQWYDYQMAAYKRNAAE